MRDGEKFSYTSNISKLLKHLDKLRSLQSGTIFPIMVHVIPTHRCQLDCDHCCFRNREYKKADMPWDMFALGYSHFVALRITGLEYTGGGDPTLWPYINRAIEFVNGGNSWNVAQGMITNGVNLEKVERWDLLDWVRVSLNTLEFRDDIDIGLLRDKTDISFCYIYHSDSHKHMEKVVQFSNEHEIVCRLAPDCIQPIDDIERTLEIARDDLWAYKDNKYVFLSDFNVDLIRKNNDCRIHMIKPCFYLDGWIYACPSSELAIEHDRQAAKKARICKHNEIVDFYTNPKAMEALDLDCSYCKYVQQQELLESLLTRTKHNAFA
jgi:MoaA/NifB/PqqE/SkfB family radical SAM enzyme